MPSAAAKLALYNAGLLDAARAAVEQYQPMKIYFDSATTWSEVHPYVLGIAAELGLTEQQKEQLFDLARTL